MLHRYLFKVTYTPCLIKVFNAPGHTKCRFCVIGT